MPHIHWVARQNKLEIPNDEEEVEHVRNPQVRWASARSRHDGSPTDTRGDTKSQCPHQDATDHCLTSRFILKVHQG
jgi:hypothetical protein